MISTAAAAAAVKVSPYLIVAFCTLVAPPGVDKFRLEPVGSLGAGDSWVLSRNSDGSWQMSDEMEVKDEGGGYKFQMTKICIYAQDKNDPYIVEMRGSSGVAQQRYDFRDAAKQLRPLHKKHFQSFKANGYPAHLKVSGNVVYVNFSGYDRTFAVHAEGTPPVLPPVKAASDTSAAKTPQTQASSKDEKPAKDEKSAKDVKEKKK